MTEKKDVIPAEAGIQKKEKKWIPVCTGMTVWFLVIPSEPEIHFALEHIYDIT